MKREKKPLADVKKFTAEWFSLNEKLASGPAAQRSRNQPWSQAVLRLLAFRSSPECAIQNSPALFDSSSTAFRIIFLFYSHIGHPKVLTLDFFPGALFNDRPGEHVLLTLQSKQIYLSQSLLPAVTSNKCSPFFGTFVIRRGSENTHKFDAFYLAIERICLYEYLLIINCFGKYRCTFFGNTWA